MDDVIYATSKLAINPGLCKINDDSSDVSICTEDGVSIRAHKAILISCPYFSAMLQGDWIENKTSSIKITGYSCGTIEAVISHLYEPTSKVQDNLDLVEALALADMLGLVELVGLIVTKIVQKSCHNFHRPCPECIPGVLSCLQLASRYSLMELEIKCINWISKHFVKVWKSRAFASLPKSFHKRCQESILNSLNIDTVMNLLLETQQLKDTLPSVKWTEPISDMIQQLREKLVEYLQLNFSAAFETSWFKTLRECDEWHIKCVQQQLIDASVSLPVEQACRAYIRIDRLIENCQREEGNGEAQYFQFLTNVHKAVENRMVQRVAMATKCQSWTDLPKAKQTSIMQLGFFSPIDTKPQPSQSTSRSGDPRTSLRRHVSLNEPRGARPETNRAQRTMPSANRSSSVSDAPSVGRSSFQRNALRSTVPRLRNVSEITSGQSESSNSSQPSSVSSTRRAFIRADLTQRAPASPGTGRKPHWR